MRTKMSREQRKAANFLLRAIRDYGLHNFDADSLKVKEDAYVDNGCNIVSYSVNIGANAVSIEYYYGNDCDGFAYVHLNDYPMAHCRVGDYRNMSRVAGAFAALVQHLN